MMNSKYFGSLKYFSVILSPSRFLFLFSIDSHLVRQERKKERVKYLC